MSDTTSLIALLYSQSNLAQISNLVERIRSDPRLERRIHLIPVDSKYARDLLRYNESRTKVLATPVFAIRKPDQFAPTLHPISSADQIFESIRPVEEKGSEEILDHSITREVQWNSDSSPKELEISPGTSIRFTSNDGILHDVTLADSNWTPIRRLIPRQINMQSDLIFDQTAHLICSIPSQSQQMRLKVRVTVPVKEQIKKFKMEDSTDQILDGISRKRIPEVIPEITPEVIPNDSLEEDLAAMEEEVLPAIPAKKLTYAQRKAQQSLHTE